MTTLDYSKYERAELLQIQKEIPIELKKRDKAIRQELRKKMQEMVEKEGFSLDEVLTTTKAKATTKTAPKYCDPADSSSTWTGRGRKPLWVIAALESGKTLDDLLIQS